jgi:hypothetical protein
MPTGLLGQAALVAITNTSVYTVPTNTFTVFSVSVLNRGSAAVTVRMALASLATPTNAEWIEYDVPLDANGVLERTGLMMNAGKQLVVYTSGSFVSVSVFGIETSTV